VCVGEVSWCGWALCLLVAVTGRLSTFQWVFPWRHASRPDLSGGKTAPRARSLDEENG
jgi:hypothetical protein